MNIRKPTSVLLFTSAWLLLLLVSSGFAMAQGGPHQGTGIKIGEVDASSAIVWTRLTKVVAGDSTLSKSAAAGSEGETRIRYRPADASQAEWKSSDWDAVNPNKDFTRQIELTDLQSGVRYKIEAQARAAGSDVIASSVEGEFRTAPLADSIAPVYGVVVTCQGIGSQDSPTGGHATYRELAEVKPDFFVHTGDVLYYDKDYGGIQPLSKSPETARDRWQRMYSYQWNQNFHRFASSYFLKDDHDTLKNDCWPGQRYGSLTFEQGVAIFAEQTPSRDVPYSTVRWGRDLQIWLLEEREFRSPNRMPDGPKKTILGETQKAWLEKTLNASDATFKLVISPGPIVGPDKPGKTDNLANDAFSYEGRWIRQLLASIPNTFVVNGDRHWQYISVDPLTGLREYGCGPINPEHDFGGDPGRQPEYHKFFAPRGGYFSLRVDREVGTPQITFSHHDSGRIDPQTGRFAINHQETISATK